MGITIIGSVDNPDLINLMALVGLFALTILQQIQNLLPYPILNQQQIQKTESGPYLRPLH